MSDSFNLADLGRRIRAARLARRLTLEDVVSQADFTVSWLSKLENGQLSPSLAGLLRIAAILDCGVDALVEGLSVSPRHVVCRNGSTGKGNGKRRGDGTIESLAESWRGRRMQPSILHIDGAGGRCQPDVFDGELFLLVLEGEVRLTYADELVQLETGDSVYLDAVIPHTIAAADRPARVLSVSCEAGSSRKPARAGARGGPAPDGRPKRRRGRA